MIDLIPGRGRWTMQNISQKSASSAQDFCNQYPIENAQTEFAENWLANVSSSARSLMTVHRSIQTYGPLTPAQPAGLIEIILTTGTTLRVGAQVDPRALRRVLAALQASQLKSQPLDLGQRRTQDRLQRGGILGPPPTGQRPSKSGSHTSDTRFVAYFSANAQWPPL
jgi:hypothetical protein